MQPTRIIGEQAPPVEMPTTDDRGTTSTPVQKPKQAIESVESTAEIAPARFRYLKPIAQGGLGEVVLAEDAAIERNVALKRIRPDRVNTRHARQRFVNEAKITGQLEHPGIVPIYSLHIDEDGEPAYAMRFIQGQNLLDAITTYNLKPSPLALRELLQRFVAICQTIGYAHSRGVIHRDLKPANVMLGEFGETLVVDWGLAKRFGKSTPLAANVDDTEPMSLRDPYSTGAGIGEHAADAPRSSMRTDPLENADQLPNQSQTVPFDAVAAAMPDSMTQAGEVIGTPAYMSPEQAAGKIGQLGPPSDIYSLGAILYCVLTGKPPHRLRTTYDTINAVINAAVIPACRMAPGVSKSLSAIADKALCKSTDKRYSTALDLAADVQKWLADEPVTAYREPLRLRVARWTRKHRTLAATIVALAVATAVGSAGIAVLAERSRRNLETESAKTRLALDAEQTRRKQARAALDSMSSHVIDDWLLKRESLTKEQRNYLAQTLEMYEEFAKETADDAATRRGQAWTNYRIGRIHALLGDAEASIGPMQRAKALVATLRKDYPDELHPIVLEVRCNRSLAHREWDAGNRPVADALLAEAMAAFRPCLERPDFDDSHRCEWLGLVSQAGFYLAKESRHLEAVNILAEGWKNATHWLALTPRSTAMIEIAANIGGWLGNCLTNLGRDEEAEARYREAVALLDRGLAENAFDNGLLIEQTRVCRFLAYHLAKTERGAEGTTFARKALDVAEKCYATQPGSDDARWHLASALDALAQFLDDTADATEKLALQRRGVQLNERAVAANPQSLNLQTALAGKYCNLGNRLLEVDKIDDALAHIDKAAAMLENVRAKNPNLHDSKQFLANCHAARANVFTKQKAHAQAAAELAKASALSDKEYVTSFALRRLYALANAGDHRAVDSAVNEFVEAARVDGHAYDLACVHGIVVKMCPSVAESHGKQAVVWLKRAAAEDFFTDADNLKQLAQDDDLAAIRARHDYQDFVAKLKAKK